MVDHPLSAAFARGIEGFLNEALPASVELVTIESGGALRVGPKSMTEAKPGKFSSICLAGDGTGPHLGVEYVLADDSSGRFFRVQSSVFGLYVPEDKGNKPPTTLPVVRVEFQRSQRPPAHVHFHTSSQPLGWVYGHAGGNYRRSESLHFPVGSERFRPTIEDFLLFLDQERLFRQWKSTSDWKQTARARLAEYERQQAIATVKHYQEEYAEALREFGWSVAAPR